MNEAAMKNPNMMDIPKPDYDLEKVRSEFPILAQTPYDKRLAFLDNAASAQKPQPVIDALIKCYSEEYANIHRGVYQLSVKATENFEAAREKVRQFINASSLREIVFVRGATEAINLVAQSYGREHFSEGDEILLSEMEHHSNIVPWQMISEITGAKLKVVPINDKGELIMETFHEMLSDKTRFVAMTHTSNALGSITHIKEIIKAAHKKHIPVLVDGCQAVPHMPVDVEALDADFYVFSGHKMYGPTGIGVLYGKEHYLEAMPPYQGGGEMIRTVEFSKTTYNTLPHKFEAGTPAIAEAIGLGAAIDYLTHLGMGNIYSYEMALLDYLDERFDERDDIQLIGTAGRKAGIQSFNVTNVHPHDVGTILDREGVAVRAGHHCAQPVMKHFKVAATVRASLGVYNTTEDIDQLMSALDKVQEFFGP